MRQIPPHLLWLGHAGDGRDNRQILDAGIQAVVQLAAEEPTLPLPRDLVYCRFPLVDGPGNDDKILQLATRALANFLEKRIPTLVVCGGGLSRSPAMAAAAFTLAFGGAPDEWLKKVTKHFPADVAPGLWDEIRRMVQELGYETPASSSGR
jgi:hypothetical protein